MSKRLSIYHVLDRIGALWRDGPDWFFQYEESWRQKATAFPLSWSLPLQTEPFRPNEAKPFFVNLLPEGFLRESTAAQYHISPRNDFKLLEALGGDCAGALSIVADNAPPTRTASYIPLDQPELARRIRDFPHRPLLSNPTEVRLSLAGTQNKLPVHYDGKHLSLPAGIAASSHILKPPIADVADSVHNEFFCMQLASQLGLTIPTCTILRIEEIPVFLIERYDRRIDADQPIRRLHQEDFCQALGRYPDEKYQNEGGPSFRDCFSLLRSGSLRPARDIKSLIQWAIFNCLIGNADAHAKNVAWMITPEQFRLAPFYDLLSTTVYPDLATNFAMTIGGKKQTRDLFPRHWNRFAEAAQVKSAFVIEMLRTMAVRMRDLSPQLATTIADQFGGAHTLQQIAAIIQQHCCEQLERTR